MIKIIDTINVENVLIQYQQLENTIQWTNYEHKGRQADPPMPINEVRYNSNIMIELC